MKFQSIHFLLILFLFSCSAEKGTETNSNQEETVNLETPLDSLLLLEAKQFRVYEYSNFKTLEVLDKNENLQQRCLLHQEKEVPSTALKYDLAIQIPVSRIVSRSTKYASFISILEQTDKLVGFVGSEYVSNPIIRQKIQRGEVQEVGNNDGSSINFEKLIALEPDVIFTYDASLYAGTSDTQQKMKELELPMILCNETLESTPLAQAEWIKFFGVLFQKEEQAKNIFNKVKSNYDSLKNLTVNLKKEEKPTIFFNTWYNDTWFMPKGESYVAQFARDAGAIYLWNDLEGKGSSPLAIEAVYEKAEKAEYWFHPSNWTKINQLVSADRRFANFESVKKQNIFNHTKRNTKGGGNDYFESGVAFPDKILEDWIKILHPELVNNEELYFYQQLK